MSFRQLLPPLAIWCLLAAAALAAGTVQLELIGDAQGSNLLFQEWAQALGNAGIRNVRLRSAADNDKIGIETRGDADRPLYIVTGVVKSRDELRLPGGRVFRRNQLGRLAAWLNDLAERGPNRSPDKKTPFGLSASQYQRVCEDLAAPVGFATAGAARDEAVRKIAARLKLPLTVEPAAAAALADDKCADELGELSCGTALACVLRAAGLGLRPDAAGGQPAYSVAPLAADVEVWPVGRLSEKPPPQQLPALFDFLNVNVQNVPAAQALEAIGKRLKTPLLIDRYALSRHNIDPAKTKVSLPRNRTTYGIALRKLLFRAWMKYEVRCDEAGTPFLWITSLKPE